MSAAREKAAKELASAVEEHEAKLEEMRTEHARALGAKAKDAAGNAERASKGEAAAAVEQAQAATRDECALK